MTSSARDHPAPVPGVLLVQNDVAAGCEEEFNRWYQGQHVPERLAVPGFRSARRYRAVDDGPAYMAVYECDSIEVLASSVYRERLANPTEWTVKIMPGFRNMLRSACRQTWSAGAGVGGSAIIVQGRPEAGREDGARRYVEDALTPDLMESAEFVRVSLWEADAAYTGGQSPEAVLRGGADRNADWVLFLESSDPKLSASAFDMQANARAAREAGLLLDSRHAYRLMHAR
jgi:hypothetical protein